MQIQGNPNIHFFGVFDGHGQFGTQCLNFVKDRLVDFFTRWVSSKWVSPNNLQLEAQIFTGMGPTLTTTKPSLLVHWNPLIDDFDFDETQPSPSPTSTLTTSTTTTSLIRRARARAKERKEKIL
jgi:hypothetical protein